MQQQITKNNQSFHQDQKTSDILQYQQQSKLNTIQKFDSPETSKESDEEEQQTKKDQQLQQSISQEYQIVSKLGSGAYGHVWKIKHKQTSQIFALKKIFSAFQNQTDAQRTYRQIIYLTKLKHDNIIKLKKVIKAQNDLDLYLLFEFMDSDLFYSIKEDLLNEMHKKYIIYQLAKCLKYLHSTGIIHRDIKPSNILINSNCQIRLCDFGLSRTTCKYNNQETKLTQFIATRWYRAPQVLFGSQTYNSKSDMWSVGCLIYQIYAKRPLLPGNDTVDQIQKLLEFKGLPNQQQRKSFKIAKFDQMMNLFQSLQRRPLNDYFKYVPYQQVKQILIHLLDYNQQKRWSADQLLNCSFLQKFKDLEPQIISDKIIKTPINDQQKKTVQIYRQTIYKDFVFNKNLKKIKQILKLNKKNDQSMIQDSGKTLIIKKKLTSSHRSSDKEKTVQLNNHIKIKKNDKNNIHIQQNKIKNNDYIKNSQQTIKQTHKQTKSLHKPHNFHKSNSYSSLHYHKILDYISKTQRNTQRKNYSSHINLNFKEKNKQMKLYNTYGKSLLMTKKQKKDQLFFRFKIKNKEASPNNIDKQQCNTKDNENNSCQKIVKNSFHNNNSIHQKQTNRNSYHYPKYLISTSKNKVPKIMQQKIAKQRNQFLLNNISNNQSNQTNRNISLISKNSTLRLNTKILSKQKISPYISQMQSANSIAIKAQQSYRNKSLIKFNSTKISKNSSIHQFSNGKQNNQINNVKKLKRKGKV